LRVFRKPYKENEFVKLGTYNFEGSFLVALLTNTNDLKAGIEKRIGKAKSALVPLLKSQSVLRAEEVKIYKTLIRLLAAY